MATQLYTGALPELQGRHFDIVHITPDWRTAEELRTGSGGLGVVSGAHSEEFENHFDDYRVSHLTIALYCPYGYVTQSMENNYMVNRYLPDPHPEFMEDTGRRIKLTINGKPCYVAINQPRDRERKHTAVINLSTYIPENDPYPSLKHITATLYGERHALRTFGIEWNDVSYMRAWQNAVLGLGAFYALKELGITYKYVHCNDSHSVFFPLHRFGLLLRDGLGYEQALGKVNAETRYTNHTIVGSGNHRYDYKVLTRSFGAYAGFEPETLRWLDPNEHHRDCFCRTNIAMRLAGPGHINAVAVEHAGEANKLWPGYGIFPITNGIPDSHVHPEALLLDGPHQIPEFKRAMKYEEGALLDQLARNAREAGYPFNVDADGMMREGTILVGFARRAQDYKRPGLLFHESELPFARQLHIMKQIAIVFGGLAHGDDSEMNADWNNRLDVIRSLENAMPVFNYGHQLMLSMKAGCDIWVGAAIPGKEACSTSPMSAMRNYAAVHSTLSGFIGEAREHVIVYGDESLPPDPAVLKDTQWNRRYRDDARALWKGINDDQVLLRRKDPRRLEQLWNAAQFAHAQYSASRMVKEYMTKLYRF